MIDKNKPVIDDCSMILIVLALTNIITLVCLLIVSLYYKIPKKIIKKVWNKINEAWIKINEIWNKIIEPKYGKNKFFEIIDKHGSLLDVGCGNDSSYYIKTRFPDILYTGIDVEDSGEYYHGMPNLADHYIITSPENFADKILELDNKFDTVISSHNLEHCIDRNKVLLAIAKALKIGGYLYLSFPTEKSIYFPGPRNGSLNYYDDCTHKDVPPNFNETIEKLKSNGMKILFSNRSYKPFFYYFHGMLLEGKSKREKKVYNPATWAYYGFEAIIWAQKANEQ